MPYEIGGRADKSGNKYEIRWVIYQMLKVIEEELVSVELEAIGENEEGIDVWITFLDGSREGQQCKGRNASKEVWDISSLKSKNIIKNWKKQLDICDKNRVSLVSPLSCQMLEDLISRAQNTNDNPQDFLNYQIKKSSKEFNNFFDSYCSELNLDVNVDTDLYKVINYLTRTSYHQVPDSFQKEILLDKIQYLFIGDKNSIYNCLENLIVEGDILGKNITNSYLRGYLKDNDVLLRNIALDTKVASRISELNEEYKEVFIPINGYLLLRDEFNLCTDSIRDGKSIIIHGKAGYGKSGCTQAIISFCESNRTPYLAIKLDKRVPNGSAEKWGIDLGLPTSIAHSLHSISKNDSAVLILDQLDALRWTQSHSRDALIICSEIIRQITNLNMERNRKISVIFICRTYDLENDNSIKSLFKEREKNNKSVDWLKILVNELDEETVKSVVGSNYEKLSKKMKSVLKIPSNLYIWQHLGREKTYDDFSTANELICEWWKQLLEKCTENDVDPKSIQNTKENIVETLDRLGRLCISCKILNETPRNLGYLASNGFITLLNNCVSFTHQSILDYFLVENMLQRYFKGENIISIIGPKESQTPSKRYQIQMLLQNIEECDPDNFINVGKRMLESSEIRFYVKYVFLEVLGQCTSINSSIENFIMEYCENAKFEYHILDNVINGHINFVELLLNNGVLDKWMNDNQRKGIAINLIVSLCPKYSNNVVEFIKKYAFISKEDDDRLFRCFSFDVHEDTDEMFELRMSFYERYPEMLDSYIDLKEMFKKCEIRAIRVFDFLINYKIKKNGKSIFKYVEDFLDEDSEIMVANSEVVIDKLLPYIPREKDYYNIYSEWSGRYSHNIGLERACIEIIKKANIALIKKNPEVFIEKYKEFMGKGYILFNEIILSGLAQLPTTFSDIIVKYITSNFYENIFDKTSGNEDELALVKDVLKKHSESCSKNVFLSMENTIYSYIGPDAINWYKWRIGYNKNKENQHKVYWSYWGDMQNALLPCLPLERISNKSKNLLMVLNRRFENEQNRYYHSNGHSGWVRSSIAQKKLGDKQWLQIITNNKVNKKSHSKWIEVEGGFIENSIEELSRSFGNAASVEPERFIKLALSCDCNIHECYVDSLFSGISFSNQLNDVSTQLLEEMIFKFGYNYDSYRARYICNIIKEKESTDWSQDVINILNDIAINHSNPDNKKPNVTSYEDKDVKSFDLLQSNAINCVRGNAASAIGNLLWRNKEQYIQFKETVSTLCNDINAAVKFANLSALSAIYNIDREWATEKILDTFEKDYRMAGYHSAKQLFFLMYPKYKEHILKIILKCYFSEDKALIEVGAHSLSEMYIQYGEFENEISDIYNMNETQMKGIIEMAILYFNQEDYNELVKNLITKFQSSKLDLEFPLSRLFYDNLINLERDKEFLVEIMKSNMSRNSIYAFVHYLEENSKSVIEYKDIILSMSYSIVEKQGDILNNYWRINNELSKLIVGLYDETSKLTDEKLKCISQKCLNIWDLMFEKRIGSARVLSQQILDR